MRPACQTLVRCAGGVDRSGVMDVFRVAVIQMLVCGKI
jgi:hypothetical protein